MSVLVVEDLLEMLADYNSNDVLLDMSGNEIRRITITKKPEGIAIQLSSGPSW
jgi:hypothetical protein